MINYVNEEAFLKWYNSVSTEKAANERALLEEVYNRYCDTHSEVFVVPASNSVTGKDEEYKFKYDDIGCCGASTIYIYF